MSFNNIGNVYIENSILSPSRRFNKTYSIFNRYKYQNPHKTSSAKNIKNINSPYNSKTNFSNHIFKKSQNYLYSHENLITFYTTKKKANKFNTFETKDRIFQNMSSLHKNLLKNKLIQTNIYKLIEKNANDNYIKKKKEREKNTFLTTIANLENNKNIFSFEKNENTPNEITNEKTKETNDIHYESESNIQKHRIPNKLQKNSMLFNKNIVNIKKSNYNYHNILSELKVNSYDFKDSNTSNDIKKLSYDKRNNESKSYKDIKLDPITIPCIKFNNILDEYFKNILEDDKSKNSLSKKSAAKLRFGIINKAQLEIYKTTLEQKEFPIISADTMFRYLRRSQKYFFEYDDLFRKYLAFLSSEIKNNKIKLNNLKDKKEYLYKQNAEILKKISDLKEEIKTYESFKKLFLMIKYRTTNLQDISEEELIKFGIKNRRKSVINPISKVERQTTTNESDNKNNRRGSLRYSFSLVKKRGSLKLNKSNTIKEKNHSISNSQNIEVPPQLPIFEKADELLKKLGDEYNNIFKKFELYNNSFYEKTTLEFDIMKENESEQAIDLMNTNNLIQKMVKELLFLKEKNKKLILYKNMILNIKMEKLSKMNEINNSEINVSNDNGIKGEKNNSNKINNNNKIDKINNIDNNSYLKYKEDEKSITFFKIYKKVKEILLNPEINIEKILHINKLYNIINEVKTKKDIRLNGEFYSKEVFCIKILEMLYLRLLMWKKSCLKNKNIRPIFLKYESERERDLKMYKSRQRILEQKMYIIKRNKEILDKANKVANFQNRKIDPFPKRYLHDEIIKKNLKDQNKIKNQHKEKESDNYYNYLQY